ncbi:MAG: 2-oxoacid:acceptor oxidoreductase subunit alpha [Candidatus Omnitrophica bacterium]|nr:2-oxoacid:acceptor oxidoreductase subunit alpha [Candidatus Omnitrophota bacterium]
MRELSILIGGKAGYGVDKSGTVIANVLGRLGYYVYVYRDYPSLIRGGHTYSIIRSSDEKIGSHKNGVDLLLALNQDAIDVHKSKMSDGASIIYDSDSVKPDTLPPGKDAIGIPLVKISQEEKAPEIMRNTCLIGAMCKALGIDLSVLEKVIKKEFDNDTESNIKIARRGYDGSRPVLKIDIMAGRKLPTITGNEALSLGLIRGGLKTYIAYPMTPTSPILHFMASVADRFSLKVIHPESEIAVILMATGCAYAGDKVAVGTSGGGFCLMTEGLSFSGMAEIPVVIVLGQRPGPSTGLPTYSTQTELLFALNAGQGEFTRFVVAPGDAEEAYSWSQVALNMSWKYQVPSIILTDKTLGEGLYSFDRSLCEDIEEALPESWDHAGEYRRYADTKTGVSPLAFPSEKGAVVKVNSYEHDESGFSTEDPALTIKMQDKRFRKATYLANDLDAYEPVRIYGEKDASRALLCWGSNKPVCIEAAKRIGLKVVQIAVFSPFPANRLKEALSGVKEIIGVESNATGQMARLVSEYGFTVDRSITKYDGRPFSVDELIDKLRKT